MIAHISIGVRDIGSSKRFYDAVLEPLGYKCLRAARSLVGYGYGRDSIALWVVQAEHPVPADEKSGLHVCFTAANASAVDAFHAAALRSGGHDIPMFTAIGAVVTFERELMVEGFRPACGRSKAMPPSTGCRRVGVLTIPATRGTRRENASWKDGNHPVGCVRAVLPFLIGSLNEEQEDGT